MRLVRMAAAMPVCVAVRAMAPETLGPVESHEDQPEGVERGDEHREEHGGVGETRSGKLREMRRLDDRILGEKARKPGDPRA